MVAAKGTRLVQRSNGIWYIVTTGNTRGVSTNTRDYDEALRLLPQHEAEDMTCGRFLLEYQAEHVEGVVTDPDGKQRPKVADPVGERIRIRHLMAHFGKIDVRDVTQDDVEAYVQKRIPQGAPSGHTHHREVSLLIASWNHHLRKPPRQRILSRDDIPRIKLPAKGDPRMVWLELDEIEAFLSVCKPGSALHTFVLLGIETGARPGAILDLTWDRVRDGVIYYHIEGRRKTKKRRPTVPVSDNLRPVLEVLPRDHAKVCGGVTDIRTSWDTARKRAASVLLEAGSVAGAKKMLEDFTPHCMRHTFATQALRHGVPIWEVAGMLGDTVETVERTYGHHCPNYLKTAANWRVSASKTEQ